MSTAARRLLLLDAGNSRVKWAVCETGSDGRLRGRRPFRDQGVVSVHALRRSGAALTTALSSAGPDAELYVCNVAGPWIARRIRTAAAAGGLLSTHFARSATSTTEVRNGYAQAWRLGVDRWVALLGAHRHYPGDDLCIIGVGSAMTIDLLLADGRHLGGCIIPGPSMMIEALLQNTAGIRRRAAIGGAVSLTSALNPSSASRGRSVRLFARDTRAGVIAGCRYACALLIDHAVRQARKRCASRPRLVLTGGGAASIAPLLQDRYRCDEDLVLRGLTVLAAVQPPRARVSGRARNRRAQMA